MYCWFSIYNFDWMLLKIKVLESFSMWIFVIETYYFWLVSLRKTFFKSHTSSNVRSITQGNMGDSLDILWSFNNTLQRDCCVFMFERLTCNVFLFTLNTIIIFLKVWDGHSKSQPLTNQSTWIPAFYFVFSLQS